MLQLPDLAWGPLTVSPIAFVPVLVTTLLALKPERWLAGLALLTALPLLWVPTGPGLVGGVVVCALLFRAWVATERRRLWAQLALLWLPVALLQPGVAIALWPNGVVGVLAASVASLAIAATLDASLRWPLAWVLALLPFAPFGDALLQPTQISAALPFPLMAARWQFTGPGEVDAASLASLWFLADRVARGLLFVALLLSWSADRTPRPLLHRAVWVLLLLAGGLLLGQTYAATSLAAHAPGFPLLLSAVRQWNAAGVALAMARLASLALLMRGAPPVATRAFDTAIGLAASTLLAGLALVAPGFLGPVWLVDPLALALLALLFAAVVRVRIPSGWPHVAAGLVQIGAAAAVAGSAWAGWATAGLLQP